MDFVKKFLEDPTAAIRKRKKEINTATAIAAYIFRVLILLAIGYIIIYPLFYMIMTSLRDRESFYTSARVWIPSSIDPVFNYTTAMEATKFWKAFWATISREMVAAVIEIVTCSIVAYGFARFKFKLKPVLIACLFITILVPETMIIIPRSVTYSNVDFFGILGLIERIVPIENFDITINLMEENKNILAFWLPSLFAMGLRSGILIYIYIQFFKGLPYELEEASWVDGAGPIRTFVSIALPSSSVVFTTVTVFSVIWHWNDTLLASMYMKDNYPLAVQLERIYTSLASRGLYWTDPNTMSIMMAGCFLFILPMLIFYMILQRRFIESIDRVGITG